MSDDPNRTAFQSDQLMFRRPANSPFAPRQTASAVREIDSMLDSLTGKQIADKSPSNAAISIEYNRLSEPAKRAFQPYVDTHGTPLDAIRALIAARDLAAQNTINLATGKISAYPNASALRTALLSDFTGPAAEFQAGIGWYGTKQLIRDLADPLSDINVRISAAAAIWAQALDRPNSTGLKMLLQKLYENVEQIRAATDPNKAKQDLAYMTTAQDFLVSGPVLARLPMIIDSYIINEQPPDADRLDRLADDLRKMSRILVSIESDPDFIDLPGMYASLATIPKNARGKWGVSRTHWSMVKASAALSGLYSDIAAGSMASHANLGVKVAGRIQRVMGPVNALERRYFELQSTPLSVLDGILLALMNGPLTPMTPQQRAAIRAKSTELFFDPMTALWEGSEPLSNRRAERSLREVHTALRKAGLDEYISAEPSQLETSLFDTLAYAGLFYGGLPGRRLPGARARMALAATQVPYGPAGTLMEQTGRLLVRPLTTARAGSDAKRFLREAMLPRGLQQPPMTPRGTMPRGLARLLPGRGGKEVRRFLVTPGAENEMGALLLERIEQLLSPLGFQPMPDPDSDLRELFGDPPPRNQQQRKPTRR